jgi:histidyl-tRNA synthetase
MRYDQTVPLARVIAQYKNELIFPFKRYQIQSVFRADNTQKGRFREFLQCDIDTVGTDSVLADIEIIQLINEAFTTLGFPNFRILLNDRSLFANIPKDGVTIIDKLKKIGKDGVIAALQEKNIDPALFEELTLTQPTERIQNILNATMNTSFDPTLARGLDYYTSTIIEVEVEGYDAGSVGGGGRYDDLIGMFTSEKIPAVGFAFGFDRVIDAMETLSLFPDEINQKSVLVTIFETSSMEYSQKIATDLRSKGISAELYLEQNAKMEKQLKFADRNNFTYAVIAGPEEVQNNAAVLKNLKSRSQETLHLTELANAITVPTRTSS